MSVITLLGGIFGQRPGDANISATDSAVSTPQVALPAPKPIQPATPAPRPVIAQPVQAQPAAAPVFLSGDSQHSSVGFIRPDVSPLNPTTSFDSTKMTPRAIEPVTNPWDEIKDDRYDTFAYGLMNTVLPTKLALTAFSFGPGGKEAAATFDKKRHELAAAHPIMDASATVIGNVMNLLMLSGSGVAAPSSAAAAKTAWEWRGLYPSIYQGVMRAAATSANLATLWGLNNFFQEGLDQAKTRQVDFPKLGARTASGVITGGITGGVQGIPSTVGRLVASPAVAGGITAVEKLIQDGKIDARDLTDIATNAFVALFFEALGGSSKSRYYADKAADQLEYDELVAKIMSGGSSVPHSEMVRVGGSLQTIDDFVAKGYSLDDARATAYALEHPGTLSREQAEAAAKLLYTLPRAYAGTLDPARTAAIVETVGPGFAQQYGNLPPAQKVDFRMNMAQKIVDGMTPPEALKAAAEQWFGGLENLSGAIQGALMTPESGPAPAAFQDAVSTAQQEAGISPDTFRQARADARQSLPPEQRAPQGVREPNLTLYEPSGGSVTPVTVTFDNVYNFQGDRYQLVQQMAQAGIPKAQALIANFDYADADQLIRETFAPTFDAVRFTNVTRVDEQLKLAQEYYDLTRDVYLQTSQKVAQDFAARGMRTNYVGVADATVSEQVARNRAATEGIIRQYATEKELPVQFVREMFVQDENGKVVLKNGRPLRAFGSYNPATGIITIADNKTGTTARHEVAEFYWDRFVTPDRKMEILREAAQRYKIQDDDQIKERVMEEFALWRRKKATGVVGKLLDLFHAIRKFARQLARIKPSELDQLFSDIEKRVRPTVKREMTPEKRLAFQAASDEEYQSVVGQLRKEGNDALARHLQREREAKNENKSATVIEILTRKAKTFSSAEAFADEFGWMFGQKVPYNTPKLSYDAPDIVQGAKPDDIGGDGQPIGDGRRTFKNLYQRFNETLRSPKDVHQAVIPLEQLDPYISDGVNEEGHTTLKGQPAIEVVLQKDGYLMVSDGNHRTTQANENGNGAIEAWVIDQSGAMRQLQTRYDSAEDFYRAVTAPQYQSEITAKDAARIDKLMIAQTVFDEEDTGELTAKQEKTYDDLLAKYGLKDSGATEDSGPHVSVDPTMPKKQAAALFVALTKARDLPELKVDEEGNLILYHGTPIRSNVQKILADGFEQASYFSVSPDKEAGGVGGAQEYGAHVVEAKVDPRAVEYTGLSEFILEDDAGVVSTRAFNDVPDDPELVARFAKLPQYQSEESVREFVKDSPVKTPVYHGTDSDFQKFDDSMRGSVTGAVSAKGAIWFTDDPRVAKAYAVYAAEDGPVNRLLAQADAAEKKAQKSGLDSDWQKYDQLVAEYEKAGAREVAYARRANAVVKEAFVRGDFMIVNARGKTPQELSADGDIDSWLNVQLEKARKLGKDGVVFQNLDDAVGLYDAPSTHVAVFDAKNVKTSSELGVSKGIQYQTEEIALPEESEDEHLRRMREAGLSVVSEGTLKTSKPTAKERQMNLGQKERQITRSEGAILRDRIKTLARGVKIGREDAEAELRQAFGEYLALTTIENDKRFRDIQTEMRQAFDAKMISQQDVRDMIVEYGQKLPKEQQGNLLKALAKAKTYADLNRMMERIDAAYDKTLRREAVSRIREVQSDVKKAMRTGNGIALDYQKRIAEVFQDFSPTNPSEATLRRIVGLVDYLETEEGQKAEIPQHLIDTLKRLDKKTPSSMTTEELQQLATTLDTLVELGRLKLKMLGYADERTRAAALEKLLTTTKNLDTTHGRRITGWDRMKANAKRQYLGLFHFFRVADAIDGYKDYGGFNVQLQRHAANAETDAKMESMAAKDAVFKAIPTIKKDWSEADHAAMTLRLLIDQGADDQAESLLASLDHYGIKESAAQISEIAKSPPIRQMAKLLRDSFKPREGRLAAAFEQIENRPFDRVENYFPLKYEREGGLIEEPTLEEMLNQGGFRGTKTEAGFTKSRVQGVKRIPRIDWVNIFSEATDDQTWYAHVQPAINNIKQLVFSADYQRKAGRIAVEMWRDWLSNLAKRGRHRANPILRTLRSNMGQAIMGYKITSIAIQPFAIFEALGYISQMQLPKGYSNKAAAGRVLREFVKAWVNPWYTDAAKAESPMLALRAGGEFAIEEGLAKFSERHLGESAVSKAFHAWQRDALKLLQAADLKTAAGVRQGLYQTFVKAGLSKERASREADFVMNIVSGSSEIADRPIALQSDASKFLFTFKSFALNVWGILAHDLIKSGIIKGKLGRKASALIGLLFILVGKVIGDRVRDRLRQAIDGKPKENAPFLNDMIAALPEQVPVLGDILHSLRSFGQADLQFPAVKAITDIANGLNSALNGAQEDTRKKGAIRALEGLMTTAGVAGTSQAFDLLPRFLPDLLGGSTSAASTSTRRPAPPARRAPPRRPPAPRR